MGGAHRGLWSLKPQLGVYAARWALGSSPRRVCLPIQRVASAVAGHEGLPAAPSRGPVSQAGPPRPWVSSSRPRNTVLNPCPMRFRVGGLPARRARWWVSWVGLPGWARASPSWPSLSGGQRPLYVRSEEAKQNNPALAPSSPSCPPPPFAVRGFPALSVTPGQLEGHEARGEGPWPEAGLWGQLRQALRAEGGWAPRPGSLDSLVSGCGSCWAAVMAKAWSLPPSSQGSRQCLLGTPHLLIWGLGGQEM